MKSVKFYTLGCKVNQYETQVIREHFASRGFREIDDGKDEKADIYVINTCTVTHAADRKSRYYIHYAYRQNPHAKVVVTGCGVQLDSDKAEIAGMPGVSHILKNKEKDKIAELLNGQNEPNGHNELNPVRNIEALRERNKISNGVNELNDRGISNFLGHTRAFLKIQDGCDNFCSYCKVPFVRGVLKSKPSSDIIQEAERLVKNGYKEIVLSGICLGAYGQDLNLKISLVEVVRQLEDIPDLLRLRLSSIEPAYVSEGLIDVIAHSKKTCRHLHIPLQSGDDEILRKMNRKYCRRDYLKLIQKIKSRIPEIAITTDVLVGFPGEKEINFKNTLDLIKEITPLKVHIFPYSRRKGTQAYNFKDTLATDEVRARIARLQSLALDCSLKYKRQFIFKKMEVLVVAPVKDNPDFWCGFTDNYLKVLVKSKNDLKNQLVLVQLNKMNKDFCVGRFLTITCCIVN
jgi:threonylcarbamoyladenosine tRNA methylthiotransferase MtaB